MDPQSPAELFPHVRILMGTIIGLGIGRLLMTAAGMVQHPKKAKLSLLHLLWMGSILLELVLFWWWEFALFHLQHWTFGIALFLIAYAVALFMLAALLAPDNVSEYDGYGDFFIKRRVWFFGLFATTFFLDIVDSFIKQGFFWQHYGLAYFIQVPIGLALCVVAWRTTDKRVHLGIVGLHIAYQLFLMSRFFNTVG